MTTLCLSQNRFLAVSILRMGCTSYDSFSFTCAVIAADRHSISGWVATLVTAGLALGFGTSCLPHAVGGINFGATKPIWLVRFGGPRMRSFTAIIIGICALAATASVTEARSSLSDTQIRQRIIAESIASYPGNCPCPYNSARNGSSCGRRSAWSRAGGAAPICYPNEISKAQVEAWRRAH